jgi:Zn finger protein HypA/HybF involved in hydrogenase expression
MFDRKEYYKEYNKRYRPKNTKYKISKETLQNAVSESYSLKQAMEKIGWKFNNTHAIRCIKHYISEYSIDISHFKGKESYGEKGYGHNIPDDELFCEDGKGSPSVLKGRYLRLPSTEYKCSCCGTTDWENKFLSLQLHHVNGNNRDNRLENLTLLCPNCHSQTETYAGNKLQGTKRDKFYYCIDCGIVMTRFHIKRCRKCYDKNRKEIAAAKRYYCPDCRAEISRKSKRCYACSRKRQSEMKKKKFRDGV